MTANLSLPVGPVTVIVPVYGDYEATRACLESVARHADSSVEAEILVVDDETPEPEIAHYLDELAETSPGLPTTLLRNETNRGFVRSVNRAIAHRTGDVVVLNSDTVVTEGWLGGLVAAASAADVATVTPLTNSGSICTLPESVIDAFGLSGAEPDIDGCAEFVAASSIGEPPDIITAVGFCMYMTRASLDACGLLDEDTFGRGYGEEVDWCLRATRMGFRHLASDSVFVYHAGAASFGDSRAEGLAESAAVIRSRYPFFKPTLRAENIRDPFGPVFASLELGLHERDPDRPHVMHLLHNNPSGLGGTEHHLGTLMASLADDFDFSVLYPVDSGFVLRTRWDTGDDEPWEEEFLLPGAARRPTRVEDPVAATALELAIDLFHVDVVHIQNLIGHSLAPLAALEDFPGTVVCSVRDLFLACPSHSLLYQGRAGCGIPDDLSVCARCLPETVRGATLDTLVNHRETVHRHLDVVDHWVFASLSSHDYLRRVYDLDEERVEVVPHGALVPIPTVRPSIAPSPEGPLRVAFVGVGWRKKGLDAVNEVADSIQQTDVEFHHFGKLRDVASSRLRVHGPYDNLRLAELLDEHQIDVVLLPGPYAETFGHVMTEAVLAGRPLVGAAYGALGERIRAAGLGWTIDPDDVGELRDLLRNLSNCPEEVERAARNARELRVGTVADTGDSYAALYRDGLGATRASTRAETMTEEQAELRRHLRAMAAVNRQLQAQLDAVPQSKRIQKVESRVEALLSRVERLVRKALRVGRRLTSSSS